MQQSSQSRPLDAIAIVVTIGLCLTWGFNQVAIKFALPDIPPLIQSAARSAIAALCVAAYAQVRGIALFKRDTLWAGVVAGVLFAVEFLLVYRGLVWTTATRGVLFLYAAPFFVVIGSRLFIPGDRFYPLQWFGLALSFVGIVVAFGVPTPAADPHQLLGDLMLVGGGIAWAATTLVIKASPLSRVSPEKNGAVSVGDFRTAFGDLCACSGRAHGQDAVGGRACVVHLPGPVGGQRQLRDLVCADHPLFRQQAFGVYFPDTPVRRRRRPSGIERAADAGFRARGRARGRRLGARQPAAIRLYQWSACPGAAFRRTPAS